MVTTSTKERVLNSEDGSARMQDERKRYTHIYLSALFREVSMLLLPRMWIY